MILIMITIVKCTVRSLPPTFVHLSLMFCKIITNCSRYLIFEQIRYHRRNQKHQPDPDEVATDEISHVSPPAPLPPDVTRVPSLPDSDYKSMEDSLDHPRDSAISDDIQRSQAVSVKPDVRNKPSTKPSSPPLPTEDCQTEDGLDKDGYLKCI